MAGQSPSLSVFKCHLVFLNLGLTATAFILFFSILSHYILRYFSLRIFSLVISRFPVFFWQIHLQLTVSQELCSLFSSCYLTESASWIEANSICCLRWWRVFRDKTHLSGAWDLTSQTPLTRSGVAPRLCSASRPGKLQSCPVSLEPTRRRRWASPCPTYWGHPGNNNAVRIQRI